MRSSRAIPPSPSIRPLPQPRRPTTARAALALVAAILALAAGGAATATAALPGAADDCAAGSPHESSCRPPAPDGRGHGHGGGHGSTFTPGAETLGDSLFPMIGNGGYDARHYDLAFDYAIATKRLEGTATIDAVATQDLSRLSFDLSPWNVVQRVTVDGRRATFTADGARSKLLVTPPRGIRNGRPFRVSVRYGGVQQPFPGSTGLREGWIPDATTGAVALNQPLGAMGWYPSNNVPADKATYTTRITVPYGWTAFATGTLTARSDRASGSRASSTFVWDDQDPTASYLYSVTVGKYDVNALDPAHPVMTSPAPGSLNSPVPFYTAVTSSLPATGKTNSLAVLGRSSEIVDYFSGYFGVPYPFGSLGGIVTLQSFYVGMETLGKPTYALMDFDATSGASIFTVVHELAHQWFGNLVTPARWRDLWLSEGMAGFSAWVWLADELPYWGSPRDQAGWVYEEADDPNAWRVPPAAPASSADLFDRFGTYRRGPAVIASVSEVLGAATFKPMMRRWLTEHANGSATTEQFVALVKETDPSRAARWTEFFRQWLYTSYPAPAPEPGQPAIEKPQITIDNFDSYVLPAG